MPDIHLPTIQPVSCEGCGVCCMVVRVPPFCVIWDGDRPTPIDDSEESLAEVRYALAVPDRLRQELSKHSVFEVLQDEAPCTWFDPKTKQCRHYDLRPPICRDFEMGSRFCMEHRERFGIR
jgi:Fe-S-cluster containining protein